MNTDNEIRFLPSGDTALVAEFGRVIDEKINDQVHQMALWIHNSKFKGITEVVPTYRSLLICYDPSVITFQKLVKKLKKFAPKDQSDSAESRILQVPCLYTGEDLDDMITLTGLSKEEIIQIHSGHDYKIYMLGFLPGFVYLGGLDPRLHAPRLSAPRTAIPAGSVGIGGSQTGIYPMESPGGWRLIGRTPITMYDPNRSEPVLCRAGDFIRFVPCTQDEYDKIAAAVAADTYTPFYIEKGGNQL